MLGQYFILWRVILQNEFSVSLFKAAGDILLKKRGISVNCNYMYSCFKGTECFSDEHLCFDLCWYNLQITTYLSQFKGVLLHDQTTFLLIYHKFCWITTNAYICQNVMFTAFQNLKMECLFFMSQATMYLHLVNPYFASLIPDKYHKSTIKPRRGLINFKHIWGGGGAGLI